ncbi:hypothetical protein [Arsenophonus sp. PmNCSU2021_1]|uniref:hypothetical protein n=1 Tax=Arsenophonus sp. PmNCSU2021_1 TaxID=3118989 RepID=UPI002FEF74B4
MNGFIESPNDFSAKSAVDLLSFFHGYGFKDKDGNELVACKDFIHLIELFCTKESSKSLSPAENLLAHKRLDLIVKDYMSR